MNPKDSIHTVISTSIFVASPFENQEIEKKCKDKEYLDTCAQISRWMKFVQKC